MSAPQSPSAFTVPPYPYDRLAEIAAVAAAHPGGLVDLSVGTPCDPPADAVVTALSSSQAERGYPSSVGSASLRSAFVAWMRRRFGVTVDPSAVAACVGTKEFVASVAGYLRLRTPDRDTVLGPAIAYPTYAMSAQLAGCRFVGVPTTVRGDLDLSTVAAADATRALCLWVNSPANPTGTLSDLGAAAAWGRARQVPVLSDECYAEFTWSGSPATIVQHGVEGVVALHSLSKRANLAGLRVGMYTGDAALVGYFSEVRKHAGLIVPGPVQAAAAVAWQDDDTVELQRQRYRRRLACLAAALQSVGLEATLPAGGFYLWIAVPDWAHERGAAEGRSGAWVLAGALAEAGGVVVSPGEFFGVDASGFVRVAAVQPDDRIELVSQRLAASTHEDLGAAARRAVGRANSAPGASTDNLG